MPEKARRSDRRAVGIFQENMLQCANAESAERFLDNHLEKGPRGFGSYDTALTFAWKEAGRSPASHCGHLN